MNKPDLMKPASAPEDYKAIKIYSLHRIFLALHLFSYGAVMALLILMWSLTAINTFFWPIFPILGWGIAVGIHLIAYLMYFDKVSYFTKIKRQSTFGILFIFHAFIFVMTNLIIISGNFLIPDNIYFYWPLSIWGIGMAYHTLGFFTWEKVMEFEKNKMKRKHPDYEEKKIKILTKSKVVNFWIFLAHITYFIVLTILIYTVIPDLLDTTIENLNAIDNTITWSTLLGHHIFSYLLYFYNESIKPVLKGLIIHITLYIASNILIIYQWFKSDLTYFWPIYSLVLWGAIIGIHVFLSMRYDYMIKDALTKIEKYYEGADKYKLHSEARVLLICQYSFISHLLVYATGIILIAIQMVIIGMDLGDIIHPIMGWMIGVAIHGALYLIILLNIRGFWKWTFTFHFAAYISTSIYLIILNVITGGILWSAIAITGWGIGIGIHAILAFVR